MRRLTRHHAHNPVPSVNLLSPWVFEAMDTRRLHQRFAAAAGVLVLLIGAGWAVQHLRTGQAQQVLAVEQAETTRLTSQTQELAPVRAYVATVDQQKLTVQQSMQSELYVSRVLAGLEDAAPQGAEVETLAITLAPPVVPPAATTEVAEGTEATEDAPAPPAAPVISPCPGPDPFNTRVVVGCITLSGSADSRATVGGLVVNLGDDPLFVEPFISTTTTADGDRVMFTGSVGLSTKSFTHRYDPIDDLLKEARR